MTCSCHVFCAFALWGASAGFTLAAPGMGVSTNGDAYVDYTGTATAPHTGKFLYRESHVLHYRGGKITERVVLYSCGNGSPFARKTVSYVDVLAPDFLLEDASNGMREGVRTMGNQREVFFRGNRDETQKTGNLPRAPGLVVDAGFDEFVRANWQPLLDGKTLSMRFLVPSRLKDMGFQVEHLRSDRVNGLPAEAFRLKLSGVLGVILPSIDVYYSTGDRVLIRYVGLSDLRDSSNDNFKSDISFPSGDRKPGREQDMAEARQARLAPCT